MAYCHPCVSNYALLCICRTRMATNASLPVVIPVGKSYEYFLELCVRQETRSRMSPTQCGLLRLCFMVLDVTACIWKEIPGDPRRSSHSSSKY